MTATASARRARIIELSLLGHDAPSIAAEIKLSVRQVRRHLAHPQARAEMAALESSRLREVNRRLGALAPGMVTVLATIAANKSEPTGARVSAARAVLETSLKVTELAELSERISSLEALFAAEAGTASRPSNGQKGVLSWPTR